MKANWPLAMNMIKSDVNKNFYDNLQETLNKDCQQEFLYKFARNIEKLNRPKLQDHGKLGISTLKIVTYPTNVNLTRGKITIKPTYALNSIQNS